MTEVYVDLPVARTNLAEKRIHQSNVNDADVCLHRLEHSLLPRTYSSGVNRAVGTGYHAGLEYTYLRIKNGITPSWEEAYEFALAHLEAEMAGASESFDWRFQVGNQKTREVVWTPDDARASLHNLIQRYYENGWIWPQPRYRILDVELNFVLALPEVPNWTRGGAIDLVVLDTETNWVHLVDHKTSKKPWAKYKSAAFTSPQAAYYTQAGKEIYQTESVTFTYDVQAHTGEFQRIDANRSAAQVEATMRRTAMIAELVEKGGPFPPNVSHYLCSEAYCDFWNECAFGPVMHK